MKLLKAAVMLLAMCPIGTFAAKVYKLSSPDKSLTANVRTDGGLAYSIECDGNTVLAFSPIALKTSNGDIGAAGTKVSGAQTKAVDTSVGATFYRATSIRDHYNQLTLTLKGGWSVEFRAYDDGVAYRFVNSQKKAFNIINETADFHFDSDYTATAPFVKPGTDGDYESQFYNSFENTYTIAPLSKLNKKRLMFLPLSVETKNGVKVAFTEADIENYPGMYLSSANGGNTLSAVFARYPKDMEQGGHNMLQMVVKSRENYIAKISGPRALPWRIAVVAKDDVTLAQTNLSYLLGAPSRVKDTSWIKPGKVAWDWWNAWNIQGVDFKSGVNNDTYKYYIDFAAQKGIEYVIMDEGWAVNKKADLMQVIPQIDLKMIVDYAAKRNVGIILWAGYYAFERDMENVCRTYSQMGVKGFKVDFLDRDDQMMTDFEYRAAAMCAKYKMVLDIHGTHKPAGINRTYPNVLNVEGVNGLEQLKWSSNKLNQVLYDVQIPFLRQMSGPMDYTQGAMLNAVKNNYHPCNSEPMSQGTRCHQLALYMVFDSPLNMLCDSPSNYLREPECTDFIAGVPTTWDETRVLCGEVGKYVVTARRKGSKWYVGGITEWTPRDITIDLSALKKNGAKATLFKDGANADRKGTDYKKVSVSIPSDGKMTVHMAPGGGFAMTID